MLAASSSDGVGNRGRTYSGVFFWRSAVASVDVGAYLRPPVGHGSNLDIAAGHLLRVLRQVETHQVTEESMGFSFTSKVLQPAFFLPLIIILFTSCAVGPNFHLPPVASPDAFRNAPSTVSTNSLADLP